MDGPYSGVNVDIDIDIPKMLWLTRPWSYRAVPDTPMIELNGVKGFLTPGDIEFLFAVGGCLPPKANYLEIGSWMGLSSIIVANGLLANANYHAQIFCVDTWRGSAEHTDFPEVLEDLLFETFQKNISEARVEQLIKPIRGTSKSLAEAWSGPSLDAVFIDGDHTFEGCYADIIQWHPHLKRGGRLLGHDAVPGGPVEQAVKHYCEGLDARLIIYPFPQTHYIWELNFPH